MPSTYAHYRLGKDVLERLPQGTRSVAERHRGIYDIGLHGPDVLFYYDALHRNPVNSVGYGMHDRPGREFFGPARSRLARCPDPEAGRAYLYGFVCHFALDSTCHPYIEDRIRESGIAHTRIEGEFDRMLLVQDGMDPVRTDLSAQITPSEDSAGVMASLIPGITAEQALRSLEEMRSYNALLVCPGWLKRRLVMSRLRKTGHLEDMGGLVLNREGDPRCEESNRALMDLYSEALGLSAELISDLEGYLDGGEDLSARFDRTFSWM